MNSRALRRLATDHAALHNAPLPPNYLFPPTSTDSDDLTQLDVLLAGPTHTPFQHGLFKLHLTIPPTYPSQPPTAHFRTPIFHPNVDPTTGGVCVETLKRDWTAQTTLRDVLVVIWCLLVQPNPDSALNAEAGGLIQEDYAGFARRAELMTGIHAGVPRDLRESVREAQRRGEGTREEEVVEERVEVKDYGAVAEDDAETTAQGRGRRLGKTARQRGTVNGRRGDGSPTGGVQGRRRQPEGPSQPFVQQSRTDDVFGDLLSSITRPEVRKSLSDDGSILDASDQENDALRIPTNPHSTPKAATPRRPQGAPTPLGELTLDSDSDSDMDMEVMEYPPSPRKSPTKSPSRHQPLFHPRETQDTNDRPESSRAAASRAPRDRNITPSNLFQRPLAEDSPFAPSASFDPTPSPRKNRLPRPLISPGKPPAMKKTGGGGGLFGFGTPAKTTAFTTPKTKGAGVVKTKSPSSAEKRKEEQRRKKEMDERLWKLCGGDVRRWNRGDFDGGVIQMRAARW